ncbi:hypothetical protein ACJMK2_034064, partial [Sinanodonta woodiana]
MDATKRYDSQEGTVMQNDSSLVASKSRRNPASTDTGSMPLATLTSSHDCEISRESVTANVTSAQQWRRPDDSLIERQATHNQVMWDRQLELLTNLSATVITLKSRVVILSSNPTADVPRRDGPARKRIRTETVPHNEGSDLSNTGAESEEDVDFENGLQNLVTSPLNLPLTEGNDIIQELSDFYEVQERCGLPIQESLAKVVNAGFRSQIAQDKFKDLNEKHLRPQNCQNLSVPKVNPEIWAKMNKSSKQMDAKLQKFQGTVAKSSVPLLRLMDELLHNKLDGTTPNVNKLLADAGDVLRMLSSAFCDMSHKRKELIKPDLHYSFQSLCSPQNKVTDLLFGDDLSAKVKNIADAQQM